MEYGEPERSWEAFISGRPERDERNKAIWAEARLLLEEGN